LTITGASGTGSVATLTFATNGSPAFIPGTLITVQGMTPSGYNGVYTVTASTATTVSYANATTGFTSGGTVTANIQTGHEVRPNFTSSGTNVFSKTNAALIIQQLTTTNATGYWGLEGTYELTQIYVGQPSGTTWSGSASAYAVTLGSAMAFDQAIKGRSYNGSNRARTLSLQPEAVEFATAGLGINSLWSTYPEHVKLVTTIASNVLTCSLHGLKVGDQVVPAAAAQNLGAGTKYYVRTVPTTSTFTLATTSDLSTQVTTLTDGTLLTNVRLYVYGTGTNTLIFRNFRAGHLHNATINYTPQVSADPLGVINFFGTTAAAQSLASSTFGSASTSPTVGSTALMPALSLAAQISVEAAADWSSGNIPSRIRLRTVAATGTTLRDTMVVDSTKVSVAVPMQLASYTIANKPATGSAGQMISISDSPTYADRMAYWTSTATACWRYVSDDTAV
jgi:hypothetical protein